MLISRVLNDTEKGYSTFEKVYLAIYWSVQSLRGYLFKPFIIYSDHKPLSFLNRTERNTRVLNWRHKIPDLVFEVKYYKGKLSTVADCLSRDILSIKKESNVLTRAQRAVKKNSLTENNTTNIKPSESHKNNKPKIFNNKSKNNIIHKKTCNTKQCNDTTSKKYN